jgi:tetratricopeptide (TPR) repeat protein
MAQPNTSPKIEELRFRIKTDPKSRLFYPLAEELRKISQFGEAEQVLRTGLATHATYLSAWVSLGRVLRDIGKNQEAVEALSKALVLDPGNVVVARLLADSYLAMGEKVEAIKKYKLVHALLPSDQETEAMIGRLESEIRNSAAPPPLALSEADEVDSDVFAEPTSVEHTDSPFGNQTETPEMSSQPAGAMSERPEERFPAPASPESTVESLFHSSEAGSGDFFPSSPDGGPFFGEPSKLNQLPESAPAPAAHLDSPFSDEPAPAAAGSAAVSQDFFPIADAPVPHAGFAEDESPFGASETAWSEPVSEREAMPTLSTPLPAMYDSKQGSATDGARTGDDEPMKASHVESPFEEPPETYSSNAFALENPEGMHLDRAPLSAEVASTYQEFDMPPVDGESGVEVTAAEEEPYVETGIASDLPFALESTLAAPDADDFAKTITMADLYAGQGLIDEARDIYEDVLARDPNNAAIRAKLEALEHQHQTASVYEEETFESDDDEPSPTGASSLAPESGQSVPTEIEQMFSPAEEPAAAMASQQELALSAEPGEERPHEIHQESSYPAEAPGVEVTSAAEDGGDHAREKVARLEAWLGRVGRREVGDV